jgi:hypothetical protein
MVATFYSPQTRFWELLSGSLLAWVTLYKKNACSSIKYKVDFWLSRIVHGEKHEADCKTLSNVLSFAGLLLLMYGFWRINKELSFPGKWALVPVLGAVLVITAGSNAWVNRIILSNRVAVWFGLISFPLYLWHWPLLSFATIVEGETPSRNIRIAAVALSLFLAWLTYQLVERPIRFGKHGKVIVTTLVALMVVVGYVGYTAYNRDGLLSRNIVKINSSKDQNVLIEENPGFPCEKITGLDGKWCTVYKSEFSNSAKKMIIWGDSSVEVFLPAFKDIARRENLALVSIFHPSCPPILGARKTNFSYAESRSYCSSGLMQQGVVDFISKEKPDLIILNAAWNNYSPFSNREFITNNSDLIADSSTTTQTIKDNLPLTVAQLSKISNVLIFKSWPTLKSAPNYKIIRLPFWRSSSDNGTTSVQFFNDDSLFINGVFDQLAISNVHFYNPSSKVCVDERCLLVLNGKNLYSDQYHITPQGSMELREDILSVVYNALNK